MNVRSLPALEGEVLKATKEYSFTPFSIPVPGEKLTLRGEFAKPLQRSKYFHDVAYKKERVVLHFTAGQLRSDLQALTQHDYHVSVAFVIARNGTIVQLFPSKYWSGHIGKGLGNISTGNDQDKKTIGIELSNYGYLTQKEGNLETYYSRMKDKKGRAGPVDVYCSVSEKAAYAKLAKPFRSQSYYASFTDEQYDSLIVLLRYLTNQYKIPRSFLPETKRFKTTNDVLKFKGIVSHINYRDAGKWDIGQAFDWKRVMEGVKGTAYVPKNALFKMADGGFESTGIRSEDDLTPFLPEAKPASEENDAYDEDLNKNELQ